MQTYFRLLADTARLLTEAIDPAEALSDTLRLLVPTLADWCAVHHADREGRMLRSLVVFREGRGGGEEDGLTQVEFEGPDSSKECMEYLDSIGADAPRILSLEARGPSHGFFLYGDFGPGDFPEVDDQLATEFGRSLACGLDGLADREELRAARDVFGFALDSLENVLIVVDTGGRVVTLNPAAVLALGIADRAAGEGTALGDLMAGWSLFDEEGRPLPAMEWPVTLALLGPWSPKRVLRVVPSGGKEYWWEVDAVPRFDGQGKVSQARLHCRDVSRERALQEKGRRALQEARNYRDLLQAALDVLPDRLAICDPSARMLYCNQAMAALLDLGDCDDRYASVLKRPPAHLEIADAEGREVPWTDIPLARALRAKTAQARLLRVRNLLTGAAEWADMRAVPISTVRGDLALVVTAIRDVTDMKGQAT